MLASILDGKTLTTLGRGFWFSFEPYQKIYRVTVLILKNIRVCMSSVFLQPPLLQELDQAGARMILLSQTFLAICWRTTEQEKKAAIILIWRTRLKGSWREKVHQAVTSSKAGCHFKSHSGTAVCKLSWLNNFINRFLCGRLAFDSLIPCENELSYTVEFLGLGPVPLGLPSYSSNKLCSLTLEFVAKI